MILEAAGLTPQMLEVGADRELAIISSVIRVDWEDVRRGGRSRVYYVAGVDPF